MEIFHFRVFFWRFQLVYIGWSAATLNVVMKRSSNNAVSSQRIALRVPRPYFKLADRNVVVNTAKWNDVKMNTQSSWKPRDLNLRILTSFSASQIHAQADCIFLGSLCNTCFIIRLESDTCAKSRQMEPAFVITTYRTTLEIRSSLHAVREQNRLVQKAKYSQVS